MPEDPKYEEAWREADKKGRAVTLTEQQWAELAYPNHSPEAALANYRAGRQVWDTNGDVW